MIDERDTVPGDAGGGVTPPAEPGAEAAAPGNGPAGAVPAPAPETPNFQDRWLRAEADLQNFRRRAARDRDEAVTRAEDALLLETVGVLDDLERALAALGAEPQAQAWAQGVALTAQRLRDLLARWDVREIEALGQAFDPAVHEALLEIDAPDGVAPGAVAQVALKGYRRGERALRAARVVVARAARD
jgi:molecular chaperone GrpE